MAMTTTTVAIGKWENRQTLDFKPVNSVLENGKAYDARGVEINSNYSRTVERRPYKIEQLDDGTSYVMYDDGDTKEVPIYKIIEEA